MKYFRLLLILALLSTPTFNVKAFTLAEPPDGDTESAAKAKPEDDAVGVCEWTIVAPKTPKAAAATRAPRPPGAESQRDARAQAAVQEQLQRDALLASLPRRTEELKERRTEDVLAEVVVRAKELGVNAPIEELTDLLLQRAWLELDIDRCKASEDQSELCQYSLKSQAVIESRFKELAGISAREFKSGRLDTKSAAWPTNGNRNGDEAPKITTAPKPNSFEPNECACDIYIYNSDRWLNHWWGLECNGHASHGVCSNNVDSSHTAGQGAMTGTIAFAFGQFRHFDCPDDHQTCFKSPANASMEWTNVCNCDTTHSQFSNPSSAFYGGDLADSQEMYQWSLGEAVAPGDCGTAGVLVEEHIQEHDPGCCDDSLGTLVANGAIGEGWNTAITTASAQNCNGGSQSGAYPYCGTFGATIRVTSYCVTRPTQEPATCRNHCGETFSTCSCNASCMYNGNCCDQFEDACCENGC